MVSTIWWQAEGTSAESIAAIAKIDIVKQRMEAAYETLQVKPYAPIILSRISK